MTTTLPIAVRLHFVPAALTDDQPDPRALCVEARDARTGDMLTCRSIKGMGAWLGDHGFRYITGTQALWSRAEPVNVLQRPFGPVGQS